MKLEMEKEIFKKGDRVFDYAYGWGEVVSILNGVPDYPIQVTFDNREYDFYTKEGRSISSGNPVLSFTEYTLEGFSQERPKFKVGNDCFYIDTEGKINHFYWNIAIEQKYGDFLLTMEEFKQFINENY